MADTATLITEKSSGKVARIAAISILLTALIAVATFAFTAWHQSIESAKGQGRLEADLSLKNNQIIQYQESLTKTQEQLRATEKALQESDNRLSEMASNLKLVSGQGTELGGIIKELQAQNADLKEALRIGDLCRPIQERISEIEKKVERSGNFGGYSSHQLEDARQHLADHQLSLRACLSSAR